MFVDERMMTMGDGKMIDGLNDSNAMARNEAGEILTAMMMMMMMQSPRSPVASKQSPSKSRARFGVYTVCPGKG